MKCHILFSLKKSNKKLPSAKIPDSFGLVWSLINDPVKPIKVMPNQASQFT